MSTHPETSRPAPALQLVKIGGQVIDSPELLAGALQAFSLLPGPKLLVHGGGKLASRLSEQLGLRPQLIEGRRVTDAESLKVVSMVYGGSINKEIVARLQALGCNALGLTGADGNLVPARKRRQGSIDWGYVGDVESERINTTLLEQLLTAGLVPVVAPLTHDGQGSLLNTNADSLASALAIALSRRYTTVLSFAFEKAGVLRDVNDPASVLARIEPQTYQQYRQAGLIAAGMIPKLEHAFQALEAGISRVRICHAHELAQADSGTILCR